MATNNSLPQNVSNDSTTLTRRDVLKALAILPAVALPTLPTEQPQSDWVTRQTWREICPEVESVSHANAARLRTWDLDLYPTLYPDKLEHKPAFVANLKGALAQIIEELSEDDLDGVYRLARMYALFPDTEGRVQKKQLEDWPLGRGEIRIEGNEIIYSEVELA